MIYFTSDTHFSHNNIIKFCNRPFVDSKQMDEVLIANWNAIVTSQDTVYHLGDVGFGPYLRKILDRLNGNICLIAGNHEKSAYQCQDRFGWIKSYYELYVPDSDAYRGEQMIALFHYPIASFNKQHHGAFHLWGHCHSSFPDNPNQRSFDIGVDNVAKYLSNGKPEPNHYRPLSYDEVKKILMKKTFKPTDHHQGTLPST